MSIQNFVTVLVAGHKSSLIIKIEIDILIFLKAYVQVTILILKLTTYVIFTNAYRLFHYAAVRRESCF